MRRFGFRCKRPPENPNNEYRPQEFETQPIPGNKRQGAGNIFERLGFIKNI